MGESKRRQQLDPTYGKSERFKIVVSDITGKYLVQAMVGRCWVTAAVYLDKDAAEGALEELRRLCGDLTPSQLPRRFVDICTKLPDDDDDEVVGLLGLQDGVLHLPGSKMVGDANALWAEHGLLSDAAMRHRRQRLG
jgi:hypothetical protein